MEEEAASSLSTLLQTLLLSVERAIERVPLDELSFPCPDCQEVLMTSCACACQVLPLVVEKRDSSIQTSPMFEYAGSIPHIDSDEESVASHEDKGTYRRLQGNKSEAGTMTTLVPQREEHVLIPPNSIRELTEKVLMCGIHLPGIHDCEGRAVVVMDTTSLTRVCLEPHQVASLLLYYNTLPRPERLKDGLTLLVVSGAAEHSTLSLLDKALLLVVKQMKVGSVLIWRRPDCSYKGNTRLETSKIKCQVIKDETNLRQLLPEDQLPTSCGGRTSHDQIEWVEFYKELEPLLSASHACGRRLAAAMADLRATEGAPTRRQLHHQHRALARALADPELHRLRREGIGALGRLQERAHWLPASEDVRLGVERARQVFTEVDRAARRLEQLSEGRREKLRELARVRALEDESTQVLSWLSKKGEETLQRHAQLATNLPAIKEQEQDFEKFYFISMVSPSHVTWDIPLGPE